METGAGLATSSVLAMCLDYKHQGCEKSMHGQTHLKHMHHTRTQRTHTHRHEQDRHKTHAGHAQPCSYTYRHKSLSVKDTTRRHTNTHTPGSRRQSRKTRTQISTTKSKSPKNTLCTLTYMRPSLRVLLRLCRRFFAGSLCFSSGFFRYTKRFWSHSHAVRTFRRTASTPWAAPRESRAESTARSSAAFRRSPS